MDTHVYRIGNNLYVNLTNRCTNRCTFCVREQSAVYEGYSLWLKDGEPSAEQVISEIGDPKDYDEVVFCGYGEPTYRLNAILKISDYVHAKGGRTRLNTNGHGNFINGRSIASELKGRLDGINISLNTPDRDGYNAVCRPQFDCAFEAMTEFAKDCKAAGLNCWFSVVDCIGRERVEECRRFAQTVGIPLRVREFIDNTEK
ncbi:MAG: TatD family nuclease-associated radical SAM protein [Candidatus Coproplasma sp.]